MKSHTNPSDIRVLSAFQTKKALTIEELSEIQQCSHITSRRRLKQWGALTSYNQNNRYYNTPLYPRFQQGGPVALSGGVLLQARDLQTDGHPSCTKIKERIVKYRALGSPRGKSEFPVGPLQGDSGHSKGEAWKGCRVFL